MIGGRTHLKLAYELKGATRIKTFAVHPVFTWVGLVTTTNVFWLVDYASGTTLKCFNCCTLDDMRPTEVREIFFWDAHTLKSLTNGKEVKPKNWVVFCCDRRIFFYNYLTYLTKAITEKELDFKSIKKAEIIAEDSLCLALSDGPMKIFDVQQWAIVKTIKGYHSKTVNWILPYKQNESQRPRVVAASIDSLMACWNVDLGTATIEAPSFKFLMKKNKAVDSNDGQEILALRYDQYRFRLITLTEDYVTFWSSLSGAEIRRFRNNNGIREIDLLHHFDFPTDSFIGHARSQDVLICSVPHSDKQQSTSFSVFEAAPLFNHKEIPTQDSKIIRVQTLANSPWYVFINATSGFYVYEVNKLFRSALCCHPSFSTRLSTINQREFYTDGALTGAITPYKLNAMQFIPNELYNFFFLSYDRGFVMLNLIETRLNKMAVGRLQFKMFEVANPFFRGKAEAVVSPTSQEISFWSDVSMYFEVYSVVGPTSQLIELDDSNKLDFYSRLEFRMSGLCTALAWHHYKSEFAVLSPIGPTGEFVKYRANKFELDSKIAGYQVCLYALTPGGFQLFFRKEVATEMHFLSGGPYFSYSMLDKEAGQGTKVERLELVESDESTVKIITTPVLVPLRMHWDETGEICVLVYSKHFSVYQVGVKGSMNFVRMFEHSIIQGFFWERLFLFSTGQSLFLLVLLPSEPVVVELAARIPMDSGFRVEFDIFQQDYIDSLEAPVMELPAGQLKLLSVVNMCLYLLDSNNQLCVLPIVNPFLRFCMEAASRCFDAAEAIYYNVDPSLRGYFDDVLRMYELKLQQIKP